MFGHCSASVLQMTGDVYIQFVLISYEEILDKKDEDESN